MQSGDQLHPLQKGLSQRRRLAGMTTTTSTRERERERERERAISQWFRLTILCASCTSASLAGDSSRVNTADIAFSACTTATSFARAIPSDLCTSSNASSTSPARILIYGLGRVWCRMAIHTIRTDKHQECSKNVRQNKHMHYCTRKQQMGHDQPSNVKRRS